MLQLAGADNQSHMSYNPEQVNPEAPVLSAYESFQGMAAAKNITLRLELPKVSLHKISCDRERIEQLLAILIDNAIRHTPEGGCIVLGVTIKRRQARFTVADNGPGIPDSQKPHVFERFYRGDSSRQAKDHYGLGLSIAREIADLHKGKLTVEDALEGGCLFTLSIHI
jgi:signal transduction histidine kinase